MGLFRRARTLLAAATVAIGISFATATPAHADHADGDDTYIKICNSINSRGSIRATEGDGSVRNIGLDACAILYNGDGGVRVDPEIDGGPDVDSFDWGYIGHGYDYCHQGETIWNPPNDAGLDGVRLDTDNHDC